MKVRWWMNHRRVEDKSAEDIIKSEVSNVNSERGKLEDLEGQVALLSKMVGVLADMLPPEKAEEFIRKTCYHWEFP